MTPADQTFLELCISRCQKDPLLFGTSILPPRGNSACYGVMVWDPITSFGIDLVCPSSNHTLKRTEYYVNNSRKGESPRLLFDSQRVILLVSSKYKCMQCSAQYLAHDEELLKQIDTKHYVPFVLFHRNAVTKTALHSVVASVITGNLFGKGPDNLSIMFISIYIWSILIYAFFLPSYHRFNLWCNSSKLVNATEPEYERTIIICVPR